MNAIILAAGSGERLKFITKDFPKPMIEIFGKPILQHNIELCRDFGIKNIFINIHYMPEKITEYFQSGEKIGVNIKYSYEEPILGTSGAIRKIAEDYWGYDENDISTLDKIKPFFVVYGDNFSNINLNALFNFYKNNNAIANIAFHYRKDVTFSGVAEFDEKFRILRYIEKPKPGVTESHWVNAAIYLFKPEILKFIPKGFSDFSIDIFPTLLGKNIPIYGVCYNSRLLPFDTPAMYDNSMEEIENDDF